MSFCFTRGTTVYVTGPVLQEAGGVSAMSTSWARSCSSVWGGTAKNTLYYQMVATRISLTKWSETTSSQVLEIDCSCYRMQLCMKQQSSFAGYPSTVWLSVRPAFLEGRCVSLVVHVYIVQVFSQGWILPYHQWHHCMREPSSIHNYAYVLQEMQSMEEHLNAEYGKDSDGESIV